MKERGKFGAGCAGPGDDSKFDGVAQFAARSMAVQRAQWEMRWMVSMVAILLLGRGAIMPALRFVALSCQPSAFQ